MAKGIGTLGTVRQLTIGGEDGNWTFPPEDIANLIVLRAYAAANNHATFRKMGTSSGYAVTSAKTLTVYACVFDNILASGAAANGPFMCYADNDVGQNSGSALTNQVYATGEKFSSSIGSSNYSVGGKPVKVTFPFWTIPAGKYPTIEISGGSGNCIVTLYCLEA
jgi:hypothetical protein